VEFENLTDLIDRTDLAYTSGVERLRDGILHVAALTRMPAVTPPMIAWWFGDYMQTTEHYKRWHPRDHVWMDWESKVPGTHLGAHHLVHEYVGDTLHKLRISFLEPEAYFGERAGELGDAFVVCARTGLLDKPVDVGRMIHLAVPTAWGCELHSRFWLGYISSRTSSRAVESVGNLGWVRRALATKNFGRALEAHCHEEMTTLAGFLPALYQAEAGR